MAINETGTAGTRVSDSILQVRNVSVTFDMERGASRVLNGVDLDIQRNEIIGIVGESGSGKSMFASALLDAVVDPGQLSGEITYHPKDGTPVDILSLDDTGLKHIRWEDIAFVVQGAQSGFNPTMTIEGHFVETLREHDADVAAGMERTRELLADLYLDAERVLDSYPDELSGGMKQRALIALGLVLEPEVVVMDEPTSALDLLMQQSIISLLADLKEKYELTLVIITHDLPLVSEIADRLVVMYAFDFVEIGPTDELLDRAAHPYTRALLNSVPNMSTSVSEMQIIEGSGPDPVDVPSGCSYHPRCPLADKHCTLEEPELTDGDHSAACFYTEQARTELPLSHTETPE